MKQMYPICCSIKVSDNEDFLKKGSRPVLFIESKGHTLHVFINKEYLGTF